MAVPVSTAPDGLQIGKPVSLLVGTLKEVTSPITILLNWKPES
jgi:hypothetical protein